MIHKDAWGIYCRYVQWSADSRLWMLVVTWWYRPLDFAIMPDNPC